MVFPVACRTIRRIQSMSGVNISRLLTLWVRSVFPTILRPCCRGYVNHTIDLICRIGVHRLQGTKVLEDREIRHHLCFISEGASPQKASPRIVKYTGSLVSPEWEDIENGAVQCLLLDS